MASVYLGTHRQEHIWNTLKQHFGDATEDFAGKANKLSYSLYFDIDDHENYVAQSLQVSTVPWAVGVLLSIKGSPSQSPFSPQAIKRLIEQLDTFCIDVFKKDSLTLYDKCQQILSAYYNECNWQPAPEKIPFYVKKRKKKATDDSTESVASETALLNSFYTSDIHQLLSGSSFSNALTTYLHQDRIPTRYDLRAQPSHLKDILSARNIPPGCWPSDHSLSLMQQVAVNLTFSQSKQPVFSVNGPPGTGKTTLLKDIIASIQVQRAAVMATYQDPALAFTNTKVAAKTNNLTYHIFRPDDKLTQFGMLVASSNNGAVENITGELPSSSSVKIEKKPFSFKTTYFREVARQQGNNWGIVAASLGNQQKRMTFVDSVWGKTNTEGHLAHALRKHQYTLNDWLAARHRFNSKYARWTSYINELLKEELFLNHPDTLLAINKESFLNHPDTLLAINKRIETLITQQRRFFKQHQELLIQDQDLTLQLSTQLALKPGFWSRLCKPKQYKQYQAQLENLLQQKQTTKQELDTCKQQHERVSYLLSLAQHHQKLQHKFGHVLPDTAFWQQVTEHPFRSQTISPWATDELKQIQVELFAAAMEVHEAFVCLAGKGITNNISVLMHLFKRELQENLSEESLRHIWNSFFMVVPVVSTTFASVATMLKGVTAETISWLFVDEAGQAVPQAALGALQRCRRAVIIGDPLQLEPVVTIPPAIFSHLRALHGITNQSPFASAVTFEASVQSLADMINPFGMEKQLDGDTLWLGCPLRVHRRCTDPMFKVANAIAYNDYMINETKIGEASSGLKSAFEHIIGNATTKQWVPEHGQAAYERLARIVLHKGVEELKNVFVISPFVAVIQEFRKLLGQHAPEWASIMNNNIGTVHTFQGKEADTVIYLCGCDANQQGAANWAVSKPNLLNVALTRAKKAFIAIGDENLWKSKKYMSDFIKAAERASP